MKKIKRLTSLCLMACMLASLLCGTPVAVSAAGGSDVVALPDTGEDISAQAEEVTEVSAADEGSGIEEIPAEPEDYGLGKVHVLIENTTYTKASYPDEADLIPWEGVLVDSDVAVRYEGMSMMEAVTDALDNSQKTEAGSGQGYISDIQGLKEKANGHEGAGWQGTLNEWFVNASFKDFDVQDGDEIHVMYTMNLGSDLGSINNDREPVVKTLKFLYGDESKEVVLEGQTGTCIAELPAGTERVRIHPEVSNKNYQVRVYDKGNFDAEAEDHGKGYRYNEEIAVRPGETLTVITGCPAWGSLNDEAGPPTEAVYKVKLKIGSQDNYVPEPLRESKEDDAWVGKEYSIELKDYFEDEDDETLTYQAAIDGADPIAVDQAYKYTPQAAGEHTLVFTANDGKAASAPFTLYLSVDNEENTHTVKAAELAGGKITVGQASAKKGEKITFAVLPDEGNAMRSVSAVKAGGKNVKIGLSEKEPRQDGSTVYEFTMPGADVELKAEFAEKCTVSFYGGNDKNSVTGFRVFDPSGTEIAFKDAASKAKPRTFDAASGSYKYILYTPDGQEAKSGTIEVTADDVAKKKLETGVKLASFDIFRARDDIAKDFKEGAASVTLTDEDGVKMEPVEALSHRVEHGGYTIAQFLIEVKANEPKKLTLSVRMADKRLSAEHMSKSIDFFNGKIMTTLTSYHEALYPNSLSATTTIRISKDSDPGLFIHSGKAYVEKVELEMTKDEENADPDHDTYTVRIPVGEYVDLVAGGDGTAYRKMFAQFDGRAQDTEYTFDLEEKGSTPVYDRAAVSNDLYTAIGGKAAYADMDVGQETTLMGLRVSQTVSNSAGNDFIEPDMHYDIISGDSVELTPAGGPGREYQTVKAVKEGITVIKVTYDDITNIGFSSILSEVDRFYCAPIDAGEAGIVIVNVGGGSGEIKSGINDEKTPFDDTIYNVVYLPQDKVTLGGRELTLSDTSSYTFTPSTGEGKTLSVRVREPVQLSDKDWNDESAWTTYEPNADGSYTIKLREGRNIVELKDSSGAVLYEQIHAKDVTVKVENTSHPGSFPVTGDELAVSFEGLSLPVYKMCGIYNPGYPNSIWVEYSTDEGTAVRSDGVQYRIDTQNTVLYTVAHAGKVSLANGRIHSTHMGSSLDSHLNIAAEGVAPNLSASEQAAAPYYCTLPDISFYVAPQLTVSVSDKNGGTAVAVKTSEDEEAGTTTWKLTASANSGYTFAGWALKSAPDQVVSKDASCEVTLSDDAEYIALFSRNQPAASEPEKQPAVSEPEKQPAVSEPEKQPAVSEPEKITKGSLNYTATGKKTAAFTGTGNKKAKSVKVPKAVKSGGVTYQVTSIAKNALKGNKKITSVAIGESVKTVGDGAFSNCKKLKKVTIGKGVVTIGKNAFAKMKKGCVVTINSTKLKTVKAGFGKGTKKLTVKVPKKKLKAYRKLFKRFKNVTVKAK